MSLIDYPLSDFNTMSMLKSFSSGAFNTFFRYAPISFDTSIETLHIHENDVNRDVECIRCSCKSVKWTYENNQTILNSISHSLHTLMIVLEMI